MLPRNCLLAKCPHCGKEKELLQLMSGNTFGAENWSDAKQIARMLPRLSPIQKCPHCGKYYLLSKAETRDGDHTSFVKGWLTFDEAMVSHKDLGKLKPEETRTVALVTLWAFNDIYRNGEVPTEEQYEMLQAYMCPLLETSDLFEDKLLNAEVYRELGCFEECLKILSDYYPVDDYVAFVAEEIRQRAISEDKQVFRIDYIPKPEPRKESPEPEYDTKPKVKRQEGIWQKVKKSITSLLRL